VLKSLPSDVVIGSPEYDLADTQMMYWLIAIVTSIVIEVIVLFTGITIFYNKVNTFCNEYSPH